jgi:L-2-hydroxyglutarate oxidase LhgO
VTADVETVVVGGGVIGLAVARALARLGHEVLVLERNNRVGAETSSRNSEVIHAGIYYPPGSMRAELCVSGKQMLYDFCAENGVAHARVGKLLVATQEAELEKLEAIATTAKKNGVDDLRRLSAQEAHALEPEVACIAAYLSPSTGVIDSHGLMTALEGHITTRSGQVLLSTRVTGLAASDDGFTIETVSSGEEASLTARNLVLSGGLGSTALGRLLTYRPGYSVPEMYPAKGHYFALSGKAPFTHLVYPMPVGAWLGVHLTLDVSGRAKFGPDIEWRDSVSYDFDDPDGARLARFEQEIRRYWPGLPAGALHPDTVGVRPKIYRQGEPAADFTIQGPEQHQIPRLVALYGMESPGLTSSLAIGEHVAAMLR